MQWSCLGNGACSPQLVSNPEWPPRPPCCPPRTTAPWSLPVTFTWFSQPPDEAPGEDIVHGAVRMLAWRFTFHSVHGKQDVRYTSLGVSLFIKTFKQRLKRGEIIFWSLMGVTALLHYHDSLLMLVRGPLCSFTSILHIISWTRSVFPRCEDISEPLHFACQSFIGLDLRRWLCILFSI